MVRGIRSTKHYMYSSYSSPLVPKSTAVASLHLVSILLVLAKWNPPLDIIHDSVMYPYTNFYLKNNNKDFNVSTTVL